MRLLLGLLLIVGVSGFSSVSLSGAVEGFYRFPSIHGDTVYFTAERDLWSVPVEGGVATRLTSHPESEYFAIVSPDGSQLAYRASYEGAGDVYLMPPTGGQPRRLTYYGDYDQPLAWTPDGRLMVRHSLRSTLPSSQLLLIDPESGIEELVPLAEADDGTWDDAGETLYLVRIPKQGSATKRYQGGWIEQLWKYTRGAAEAVPLTTDYAGTSNAPMWWKGRVYFRSDRDGTMNLWSIAPDGSDLRQHTFHSGFDLHDPSLGDGRIVYRWKADLYLYDIAGNSTRRLPIRIASDLESTRERCIDEPMEFLTDLDLDATGEEVLLSTRGRTFVAPVEKGRRLREVTHEDGVRFRGSRFLPESEDLILLSDASGEPNLWRYPAKSAATGTALSTDADVLWFAPVPSPDGKWIAWADKAGHLLLDAVEGGARRVIYTNPMRSDLAEAGLTWSPDSRWVSFAAPGSSDREEVFLYDVEEAAPARSVTSPRHASYSPAFSRDGKWLYFISSRRLVNETDSPWGDLQSSPQFGPTDEIYLLDLVGGQRSPFVKPNELEREAEKAEAKSEAETASTESAMQSEDKEAESASKEADARDSSEDERPTVEIAFDGLVERLFKAPVPSGHYNHLKIADGAVLVALYQPGNYDRFELKAFAIQEDEVEVKTIAEGLSSYGALGQDFSYALSGDGKKVLFRKGDSLYVTPAAAQSMADPEKAKIDLGGLRFTVDPRSEWRQMFVDAWRLQRDFFYDKEMHGVEWEAVRDRYLPLVDRVTDRLELNEVIAEAMAELSALHVYVFTSDIAEGKDQIAIGFLGADLRRTADAGGYRITRIYSGDPDFLDELGPLSGPRSRIMEGDVITHVDGVPTLAVPHLQALLREKVGRPVRLGLTDSEGEAYEQMVHPISRGAFDDLRYHDWEYARRKLVEEWSDGRIGYVHLRAMGQGNYDEFAKGYFPSRRLDGLIIDVRHNGGGNIDSWILNRLIREAWMYWSGRGSTPSWNMQHAFRGHLATLVDAQTASDGETFALGFRQLGLGPVIGQRTWGGGIWLSFQNRLLDNGLASSPQFGSYSPDREWNIEGTGVTPDLIVDNLPHATFLGEDAQLRAAVDYLLEQIEQDPRTVPSPPAGPDHRFVYPENGDE
jgi:tricorn protease